MESDDKLNSQQSRAIITGNVNIRYACGGLRLGNFFLFLPSHNLSGLKLPGESNEYTDSQLTEVQEPHPQPPPRKR